MKIVVIGGSGLIGSKLVPKLREREHEALAASPNSVVNSVTGQGLADGGQPLANPLGTMRMRISGYPS